MMRQWIFWSTLLIAILGWTLPRAEAQVFPPDLLCLSGDTVVWDLPVNNCGPFQAYEIYRAPAFAGPYALNCDRYRPGPDHFF
jgi:hypothetical protein